MEDNKNMKVQKFYADDEVLAGEDWDQIKNVAEIEYTFFIFSVEISIQKTEMMIMYEKQKHKHISMKAYDN